MNEQHIREIIEQAWKDAESPEDMEYAIVDAISEENPLIPNGQISSALSGCVDAVLSRLTSEQEDDEDGDVQLPPW